MKAQIVTAILAVASLALPSAAQQAMQPQPPAPNSQAAVAAPQGGASREDVLHMMDTMHVREQSKSIMDAMIPQIKQMVEKTIDPEMPDMNAKQREIFQRHMSRMME